MPELKLQNDDALLIVDVQNDFLPGGSLAVPEGDRVIVVLNACIGVFRARGLAVIATRDWHTPDHCSFLDAGGAWPPHCVAGTPGAGFAPDLTLPDDAIVVSKATTRERDAYSGFEGTDLDARLKSLGIARLFIGGLATDYCVFHTVCDALDCGYRVMLLEEACRAVDGQAGDGARAIREMNGRGAIPVRQEQLQ